MHESVSSLAITSIQLVVRSHQDVLKVTDENAVVVWAVLFGFLTIKRIPMMLDRDRFVMSSKGLSEFVHKPLNQNCTGFVKCAYH